MDKQKLIEKYKKEKKHTERFQLQHGVVIGTEVDENNQLLYVIKDGNEYRIEKASKNRPIASLLPISSRRHVIVRGK